MSSWTLPVKECALECIGQMLMSTSSNIGVLQLFSYHNKSFSSLVRAPLNNLTMPCCFPASFGGQCCLLAPCILSAKIPCLASQSWMTDVGAVIDLAARHVNFTNLGVDVPLCMINGHLAFDVIEFDLRREHVDFWKNNHHRIRQSCSDSGIQEYMSLLPSEPKIADPSAALVTTHAGRPATSAMAPCLGIPDNGGDPSRPEHCID